MTLRRFLAATAFLFSIRCFAAPATDFPNEAERLLATAKLWATVEYFHPYVATRLIDWDAALVRALPAIRTAHTPDAYQAALRIMLDALKDQSSYLSDGKLADRSDDASGPVVTLVHHGVHQSFLVVNPAPPPFTLPVGAGISATLNLSEPANGVNLASVPPREHADPESPYPSVDYRILAAYKMWASVRNFFAYRDLMDGDWDDYFAEFLPKFIAAKDEREYNLAAAAALTHVDDTNAKIHSAELGRYFGIAAVGLRIRLVEKKPVVTAILDDEATKAGVKVGDVVTSVDGEEIVGRIHREIEYIPASTNQSLAVEVCKRLLNGPENSAAILSLESGDGNTRQVTLHRDTRFAAVPLMERPGEATRFLSKAIGYADLEKVKAEDLDGVFEKFANMTAIIFDLRGNIGFEPQMLASRLTAKPDTAGAIVTGPITLRPDLPTAHTLTDTASFFRVETFPPHGETPYTGKTIAVIDERTIGRAEHLGLLLEAANNTTFVGSFSAGADGEVTQFSLPGGITYSFSTTDVRHGNGGKLQRLGLQVQEVTAPTVHSIRTGTDEALEKAMESVSQ